ncbi:MAG: 23S rRNA (pseudouridine(1915)-N(3))-methyltransferase RlmH [Kofleriaceae bacterium]|nr:23S rRNA (pseudouridine(1915)-N(3))-methyltransferase RlmH [Kofleriaceae bacterium]
MNISLLAVGRLKESYFKEAQAEYLKRLRPYCNLKVSEQKTDEAMLAAIPERALVIALDERGKQLSSREFANIFEEHGQFGGGAPLVFAIGGADGHNDALRSRANKLIAFGRATIAHRLVRLVLLEQIYRGFRIVRGEPYHRD